MSDPLADLEALVPGLETAAAGVRLGEKAGTHLQRFSEAERQSARLGALIDLALLLGAQSDVQVRSSSEKCLHDAAEAAEAMIEATDEEGLGIAVEAYSDFGRSLQTLEATLRPVWATRADAFNELASVGSLLATFAASADLGARMVAAAQAAQAARQGLGPEHLLTTARELLTLRQALLAEQQSVAGDPTVSTFLQALAEKRATLDLLSVEVLAWLRNEGALERLQVVSAQ